MNCNYSTSRNGKRNLCPSASHEGLILGVMMKVPKKLWEKKEKRVVMFCQHHAQVVKAKMTSNEKGVNEHGEFFTPKTVREVANEHLATEETN